MSEARLNFGGALSDEAAAAATTSLGAAVVAAFGPVMLAVRRVRPARVRGVEGDGLALSRGELERMDRLTVGAALDALTGDPAGAGADCKNGAGESGVSD